MNAKRVPYILAVLISTTILGLASWCIFKYLRRHMVLRAQQQEAADIDREMKVMLGLGFGPESELISILAEYKRQIGADEQPYLSSRPLIELLNLNKKMLMSYVSEIKQLRKQGVDPRDSVMKFAYDKVVRLTIATAELEKQIRAEEQDRSEFQKRVERMKEITRQSVAHYKNQLRNYIALGFTDQDERVQHCRRVLTVRMKHLCMM